MFVAHNNSTSLMVKSSVIGQRQGLVSRDRLVAAANVP
jgi:hypothetical protein